MRANYGYIPYLYCSNHRYISIAEVRTWLAAGVSVATISVQEKLTLLDFSMQEDIKQITTAKKDLFEDLSELFSKPVASRDDVLEYIPTQYIAECVKKPWVRRNFFQEFFNRTPWGH